MERLVLTHWRAPGDIVCMTAAVRDLVLAHPGRYEVHVAGPHAALWAENPYIARAWGMRPPPSIQRYRLSCQTALIQSAHRRLHYLTAFHRDLERRLQAAVPLRYPRGDLHLSAAEKATPLVEDPYWLVVAGGKSDMPVKVWPSSRFQQVVDRLANLGIRCVQAGARQVGHRHPRLRHVIDYVGKTSLRDYLRLVYHAQGVLCPVSLAMHVAAVFDKPCVVVAGGREPWWWNAYTNTPARQFGEHSAPVAVPHHYLHAIGRLACCRTTGCWKTHVVSAASVRDVDLCEQPVDDRCGPTPRCLHTITVEDVMWSIRQARPIGEAG